MSDFLRFVFPFAPESREKALAREILASLKGGEGSGNFGHAGRPGEVGGSAESDKYATKPPKLPPELIRSTNSQTVQDRLRERASIMENVYGVKFSDAGSNPLGVLEGKKRGIPGVGLPRAIFDKNVTEISTPEKVDAVIDACKKFGGSSGYSTYTTIKYATGLSFREIFGVVKYLQKNDPYSIAMSVDRFGKNTVFAIKKDYRP